MGLYQEKATYRTSGFDRLPDQLPPGFVSFDTETTGLDLRGKDRPFCFSIANASDEWCCEWNERSINWIEDQLIDRDLVFLNAKFDTVSAEVGGCLFEDLGIKLHEVQHCAGLLDDHRRTFSLDALALERLKRSKVALPHPRVWELPTPMVVQYARADARLTYDIWQSYQQEIDQEDLRKVLELEDSLIYSTIAMERNGCPIDVPKLERWCDEVKQAILERTLAIWQLTGLRVNPDSGDIGKLFRHLGIAHTGYTTKGGASGKTRESFADHALEEYAKQFKPIQLALEIRQLKSWLSKCGDKYLKSVKNGVLYGTYHQMRADEGGTITGRYAGDMQQVPKPDKQNEVTKPWIVRELFLGADGNDLLDTDASQIEYRLFAHFSCVPYPHSRRLIKAYENPNIDFHDYVTHDILHDIMIRSLAKNVNFAKLYGAGPDKISAMTGLTYEDACKTNDMYDGAFPEAKRLLSYCTRLAENRGWVKTSLGRKRRYVHGDRFYSALNSVLQGTAADVMKLKMLRLYNERKTTGFTPRLTFHDEILGDVTCGNTVKLVTELLAVQELKLRVPLTWEVGTGKNWYQAMGK